MTLLQMSIAGAVLTLTVSLIRALTINKLSKKTFMVLWWVVAARLLIPFSFSSPLSIYTLLEKGRELPKVQETFNRDYVLTENIHTVYRGTETAQASWNLGAVWVAGMLIAGIFLLVSYLKSYKEFQSSLPIENSFVTDWLNSHPLKRSISIRQSDRIAAPLTYGILHPVILLPKKTDWENEKQLEFILEHEYIHIKRFDVGAKLIFAISLCVHWFNPAVWIMYILANRDIEIACDEAVLHKFGEKAKSTYARILVNMEERKYKTIALSSGFSKNAIEERIVAIMKSKKRTVFTLAAEILLVAVVVAAFATTALAEEPNTDVQLISPGIVTTITEENGKLYYILGDGRKLDQDAYEKEFPEPDIEWWTYEEYKEWLENEKKVLQSIIGQRAEANGKEFIWTQETVDETIAMYEEILQSLKKGIKISKTVNGSTDMMIGYDPADTATTQSYTLGVTLNNGEQHIFGPYTTSEEILPQIMPFLDKQLKQGNLDREDYDTIISDLERKK